ncbi:hypothetical protein ACNKHV_26505 [Shigella flexneri]
MLRGANWKRKQGHPAFLHHVSECTFRARILLIGCGKERELDGVGTSRFVRKPLMR